jgi:flagellar basal-body rod protein FlgB
VSLEDQMIKMTEARTSYDAAITFYQKSLAMLRMAARKPNG